VVGNSAGNSQGGVAGYTLNNCIVYFNTAPVFPNLDPSWSVLNNCCTTPWPTNGVGNITNNPAFIDLAAGNLRPQANSPCINSGQNSLAPAFLDLDGDPRVAGGTVDIGAYEFQAPASVISYAWLQQYGLPTDGSADDTDADSDSMNNWQEWIAGTNPTNALSNLKLIAVTPGDAGMAVSWSSVLGKSYYVERAADLRQLDSFLLLQSNLVGQAGSTTFIDATATKGGPLLYRVGVQR
jgi:hypothetical protein